MKHPLPLLPLSVVILALGAVSAAGDPIHITGGSAVAARISDGTTLGLVDVQGMPDFRLSLQLGLLGGPWGCSPCGAPGDSLNLSARFDTSDGFGTVELGGASYPVPSGGADAFLTLDAGTIILPPLDTSATVSARFEVNEAGSAVLLFDVPGGTTQMFPLTGRGVARMDLIRNRFGDPLWEFDRLTYEFSPVPEPGTVLLFGTGVASLVLRRRSGRRAPRPAVECC